MQLDAEEFSGIFSKKFPFPEKYLQTKLFIALEFFHYTFLICQIRYIQEIKIL